MKRGVRKSTIATSNDEGTIADTSFRLNPDPWAGAPPGARDQALEALRAGITEANRRARAKFDGLLGTLPGEGSGLLSMIFEELRDFLLERYSDDKVRELLAERKLPTSGEVVFSEPTTEVDEDVELALRLLGMFERAAELEPDDMLRLLLGARDQKRQKGARDGGLATAGKRKTKATSTHAEWFRAADELVQGGKSKRDIASILAVRFGKPVRTIRYALKKRQ